MKSTGLPANASAQARRAEQTQPIAVASSESLTKKVVRGGFWVFALRLTNRGLGFIRTIILARLLAPSDFGLLGMAMLAISTLETFSQTGFQAALIQKKENVESYLDTAWTVSVLRGVFLFGLLFFLAPLVANFFNSPQAILVTRVIAITVLLSGLKNVGLIFFQKELQFNKLFFYQLSGALTNFCVGIVLAFTLRNVWALVWSGLAANFVQFFMSYIVHPYRPRLRFEKAKFQDLFRFGKWVVGSGILIFLITQGDDIFVGKMLGVTALGFYQMAYLISNLPATEITHVISQVTFPAYSKLHDDLAKLREAYFKVFQLTAFISFPFAIGISVLASDFTEVILGQKWMPIVPAVQILVFAGFVRSIAATSGFLFYAVGRAKIDTFLQIIRLVVLGILIYPLAMRYQLIGLSIAVFLSIFVSNIGYSYMAIRITKCDFRVFCKLIAFPVINGAIVGLFILYFKTLIETGAATLLMFASILLVSYLLMVFLTHKLFDYRITIALKDTIAALRRG